MTEFIQNLLTCSRKLLNERFRERLNRIRLNILLENKKIIHITFLYFILSTIWLLGLHHSFLTTGDLGHYVQMFENTVSGNGVLTTDLRVRPGNPEGFYLWEHFATILFAFVPIYYIFPYIESLLILKTLFISISIPVLWLLARKYLDEKLSLAIIISYILNPFLFRALSFNFQEQIVLPFIIFAQFYFYFSKKYKLFVIFTLLGLFTSEYVSLLIASSLIGLFILEYGYRYKVESYKVESEDIKEEFGNNIETTRKIEKKVILLLAIFLLSMVYYFTVISIMHYSAEAGVVIKDTSKRVDLIGYIMSLIFDQKLIDTIFLDIKDRILYINMSMIPVFYTALLSPVSIFPLILYIGSGWITNNSSIYEFEVHHPFYILPYIYIGCILALKNLKLDNKIDSKIDNNRKNFILRLVILVSISLFIFQLVEYIDRDYYPTFNDHTKALHKILDMIPEEAPVLAQGNIQPNIANREKTFNAVPERYYGYLNTKGFINYHYIIFDKNRRKYNYYNYDMFKYTLDKIIRTKEYGIWLYTDDIYVLKRGYNGSIIKIGERLNTEYTGKNLRSYNGQKKDILMHPKGSKDNTFWFGPYKSLGPGKYKLIFEIKRDGLYNKENDRILTLDVTINRAKDRPLISRDVNFSEIKTEWTNITLLFQSDSIIEDVEFRGMKPSPNDNIYLRKITIEEQI